MSYTALRKERENFRTFLVRMVMQSDETNKDPTDEEKKLRKYYYYIRQGTNTVHVSALDPKLLNRVNTIII